MTYYFDKEDLEHLFFKLHLQHEVFDNTFVVLLNKNYPELESYKFFNNKDIYDESHSVKDYNHSYQLFAQFFENKIEATKMSSAWFPHVVEYFNPKKSRDEFTVLDMLNIMENKGLNLAPIIKQHCTLPLLKYYIKTRPDFFEHDFVLSKVREFVPDKSVTAPIVLDCLSILSCLTPDIRLAETLDHIYKQSSSTKNKKIILSMLEQLPSELKLNIDTQATTYDNIFSAGDTLLYQTDFEFNLERFCNLTNINLKEAESIKQDFFIALREKAQDIFRDTQYSTETLTYKPKILFTSQHKEQIDQLSQYIKQLTKQPSEFIGLLNGKSYDNHKELLLNMDKYILNLKLLEALPQNISTVRKNKI